VLRGVLLAAFLGAALVGCGGSGGESYASLAGGLPPGLDPDSTAAATLLRLHDYTRVSGRREGSGGSDTFTAYLSGGDVVFIRDRVTEPEGGTSENRYFFHDGRLFLYHGEGVLGDAREVLVRLVFSGGRLVETVKTVNGTETPLPEPEIAAALAPVPDLLASVRSIAVTSPHRGETRAEAVALGRRGEAARLRGSLGAGDHRDYEVQALAGSELAAGLSVSSGAAHGAVRFDNRVVAEFSPDAPWSQTLTEAGPYVIRVIASASADSTDYTLELRFR